MLRTVFAIAIAVIFSLPAAAQKTKAPKKASWDRANAYTITHDRGGDVEYFHSLYSTIASHKMNVVIDGPCYSACTFFLGLVPADRLCATPKAKLGFHSNIEHVRGLQNRKAGVVSEKWDNWVYEKFPPKIVEWIEKNGGLQDDFIYLEGEEVLKLIQRCR